jgi:hypothetical protein
MVGGVSGGDLLEEVERFDCASRPRKLLRTASIRRRRLAGQGHDERSRERHEHADLVVAGDPAMQSGGLQEIGQFGAAQDSSADAGCVHPIHTCCERRLVDLTGIEPVTS